MFLLIIHQEAGKKSATVQGVMYEGMIKRANNRKQQQTLGKVGQITWSIFLCEQSLKSVCIDCKSNVQPDCMIRIVIAYCGP